VSHLRSKVTGICAPDVSDSPYFLELVISLVSAGNLVSLPFFFRQENKMSKMKDADHLRKTMITYSMMMIRRLYDLRDIE